MKKPKVAIFGTAGSFHFLAAQKYFGKDAELVECYSFMKCCEALESGKADYAVLAIENALAGSILPNYNLLNEYKFHIIGEQYLKIELNLLALKGVKISDIEFVHSHPMALAQCTIFLNKHPHIKAVEQGDTASCVKNISDKQLRNTAAVANEFASELYNVPILQKGIENNKFNYTRFFILSRTDEGKSQSPNKASICFRLKHKVGSLSDVLNIIKKEKLNLSKIQSVPVHGEPGQYFFHLDVEWKKSDYEHFIKAMAKIKKATNHFAILGEYEKASVNIINT
jgi:prephenate dehydratase